MIIAWDGSKYALSTEKPVAVIVADDTYRDLALNAATALQQSSTQYVVVSLDDALLGACKARGFPATHYEELGIAKQTTTLREAQGRCVRSPCYRFAWS